MSDLSERAEPILTYRGVGDDTKALIRDALAEIARLAAENERLIADRRKVWEWMREPDEVGCASLDWLLGWINRRPFHASADDHGLPTADDVRGILADGQTAADDTARVG